MLRGEQKINTHYFCVLYRVHALTSKHVFSEHNKFIFVASSVDDGMKKALLTIWTLWRLSCWHWCYCYYMLFRVYSFFARHHHHDHQIIITIPWWLIIKSLFDSGRGRERPKERKILQWTNYNGGESSKSSKRGSHNITSSYLAHLKLSILFCAFFLFFLKSEDCL